MNIIINHSSMVPIYEQLCDSIKKHIHEGLLCEGDILPSVRVLAKELKISALTVKKAYDSLEADGYLVTVHGKGSFVAKINAQERSEVIKKEIEKELENVIDKGRRLGLSDTELKEMFLLIIED